MEGLEIVIDGKYYIVKNDKLCLINKEDSYNNNGNDNKEETP